VEEASALPKEQKIAWLTYRHEGNTVAVLERLFPSIKPPQRTIATIWTSRMDGTQLSELGSVSLRYAKLSHPVRLLRWVPGGKRISYVYADALYTLPVR